MQVITCSAGRGRNSNRALFCNKRFCVLLFCFATVAERKLSQCGPTSEVHALLWRSNHCNKTVTYKIAFSFMCWQGRKVEGAKYVTATPHSWRMISNRSVMASTRANLGSLNACPARKVSSTVSINNYQQNFHSSKPLKHEFHVTNAYFTESVTEITR
jgi:hypothetical protein